MVKTMSVKELPYKTIPINVADEVENSKIGLFGGGKKRKFAKCISEGKAEMAEVIVETKRSVTCSTGDSNLNYYYADICSLDHILCEESVIMPESCIFILV